MITDEAVQSLTDEIRDLRRDIRECRATHERTQRRIAREIKSLNTELHRSDRDMARHIARQTTRLTILQTSLAAL